MKSLSTQRADAVITFVRRGCACKHFEYSLLIANVIVLGDEREKVGTSAVKMMTRANTIACITELSRKSELMKY
jgi:hypothetical protein